MPAKPRFPRLRVMAEYASSGIWSIETVGPFRHGMVEHAALGLPADLALQFQAWIAAYWLRLDDQPFDVEAFNATGRSLAQALKAFLGPSTYVEYVPELADGGLGPAEEVD